MAENRITVLVEDTVNARGLLAEHGLAFWIELNGKKILFDTGQSNLIISNSQKLGIDLKTTDAILLSHGHYDHTGGLTDVLDITSRPHVYAHHKAFAPKYTRNPDGTSRKGGMTGTSENVVRQKTLFTPITGPTEVCDGLYLTGPIPRENDFEDTGGPFFKDVACTIPDDIQDDQAALIVNDSGVTVVLGCAHSGVINTLHYIQKLTDFSPINTLIGGMHLVSASPERFDGTISELRKINIERFLPCHCTGISGIARLWQEFPDRCSACPVGTVIELGK